MSRIKKITLCAVIIAALLFSQVFSCFAGEFDDYSSFNPVILHVSRPPESDNPNGATRGAPYGCSLTMESYSNGDMDYFIGTTEWDDILQGEEPLTWWTVDSPAFDFGAYNGFSEPCKLLQKSPFEQVKAPYNFGGFLTFEYYPYQWLQVAPVYQAGYYLYRIDFSFTYGFQTFDDVEYRTLLPYTDFALNNSDYLGNLNFIVNQVGRDIYFGSLDPLFDYENTSGPVCRYVMYTYNCTVYWDTPVQFGSLPEQLDCPLLTVKIPFNGLPQAYCRTLFGVSDYRMYISSKNNLIYEDGVIGSNNQQNNSDKAEVENINNTINALKPNISDVEDTLHNTNGLGYGSDAYDAMDVQEHFGNSRLGNMLSTAIVSFCSVGLLGYILHGKR